MCRDFQKVDAGVIGVLVLTGPDSIPDFAAQYAKNQS